LHEEAWEELEALAAGAPLPIAGGDLVVDGLGLRARVRDGALSVLTPDAAFAGLGTLLEAMRAALARGLAFSPASHGDGLSLAANVHALAAWSAVSGAGASARLEYPWEPPAVIPELRDALLASPLAAGPAGEVQVPGGPGLGVALDPRSLRRHGRRFFVLTPVRFVVSSARRSGLKQAVEQAGPRRARARMPSGTVDPSG
jgi:L-alanine-DL-glutamate epimerase-like enolase superfamily enzyme